MKRDMKLNSMDTGYLDNFFRGAWIHDKKNTRVLSLYRVTDGGVLCQQLDLKNPYHRDGWDATPEGTMPLNMLDTFSTFSWPKLGYRNFIDRNGSNTVHYFSSQRSTSRGLRAELLSTEACPVYHRLGYTNTEAMLNGLSQTNLVACTYAPVWVGYTAGMGMLRSGKWAAFAVNEDITISLALDIQNFDGYEILFRGDRVGTISGAGSITFGEKALSVKSLRKLLERELY